jgi:cephalosporin hydroxylase
MKNNHGSEFGPTHGRPITTDCLFEINKRFMGGGMSQNYAALYIFEHYLQLHDFDEVIEIGSQKGALSLFFANMAAVTERFRFSTFEINLCCWYNRPGEGVGHWFDKLQKLCPEHIQMHNMDCFSDEAAKLVQELIKRGKTLIFCDGGNKVKEFKHFVPMIKPGDRLMVHDWEHEIWMNDLVETMQQHNIVVDSPFDKYCTILKTWLMPFVKL